MIHESYGVALLWYGDVPWHANFAKSITQYTLLYECGVCANVSRDLKYHVVITFVKQMCLAGIGLDFRVFSLLNNNKFI